MENISNFFEVTPGHSREKNWIDMNKETRNLFHRKDEIRTWVIFHLERSLRIVATYGAHK